MDSKKFIQYDDMVSSMANIYDASVTAKESTFLKFATDARKFNDIPKLLEKITPMLWDHESNEVLAEVALLGGKLSEIVDICEYIVLKNNL